MDSKTATTRDTETPVNVEKKTTSKQSCSIGKDGINIMGQSIPWIAIVLVIAILIFGMWSQGLFNNLLSQSTTPSVNVNDFTRPLTADLPSRPQSGGNLFTD